MNPIVQRVFIFPTCGGQNTFFVLPIVFIRKTIRKTDFFRAFGPNIFSGRVYTRRRRKITSPPGGQRPPQAENFGDLGDVLHKNHVAGVHSGTCFRRKTRPKSSKISACGEPNPQNVSLFLNFSRIRTLFLNFSRPPPHPPHLPVNFP